MNDKYCPKCMSNDLKLIGTPRRGVFEYQCTNCGKISDYYEHYKKIDFIKEYDGGKNMENEKQYEVKYGKFGVYFFDKKRNIDLALTDILDLLNALPKIDNNAWFRCPKCGCNQYEITEDGFGVNGEWMRNFFVKCKNCKDTNFVCHD